MPSFRDDPHVLETLRRYAAREITRPVASEILQVSERAITKYCSTLGIARVEIEAATAYADRKAKTAAFAVKRAQNNAIALDYIAGIISIEQAAERSADGHRNMRRAITDLLAKHSTLSWVDLKKLSSSARREVAMTIARADGIDLSLE